MSGPQRSSRLLAVVLFVAVAPAGCTKEPVSTPANPTAPAPDNPVPQPTTPAPSDPAADPGNKAIEKSEELRFIEANAALLCFERANRRAPKDKERVDIVRGHGFGGKTGEQHFLELSIRGEKDRDWGRRTAERIKEEAASLCPPQKKGN